MRKFALAALFFDNSGRFAFLHVVLVPRRDFSDVGAGLFDDALAAEAAVELQARGKFEAVELKFFGFGDPSFTLLEVDVAGGAGGYAAAGVVEEDTVVFGDVEERHREAMAVVRHGAVGELYGFVFGLKGDADHVFGRGLGEIDFGERDFVFRHVCSSVVVLENRWKFS
jgi:hypothetical protein